MLTFLIAVCKTFNSALVGASSLAGGHTTLIPELVEELAKMGSPEILVVAGGIIPEQDHQFLFDKGVIEIFGPGTIIAKAAIKILNRLMA